MSIVAKDDGLAQVIVPRIRSWLPGYFLFGKEFVDRAQKADADHRHAEPKHIIVDCTRKTAVLIAHESKSNQSCQKDKHPEIRHKDNEQPEPQNGPDKSHERHFEFLRLPPSNVLPSRHIGQVRFALCLLAVLILGIAGASPAMAIATSGSSSSGGSSTNNGSTGTAPSSTTWSCNTCKALQSYIDKTNGFASTLATTLSGPINGTFLALAGLWMVIAGVRLGMHMAQYLDIAKEMVWVLLAALLLGAKGTALIPSIYSVSLAIMGGASAAIFSMAGGASAGGDYTGLTALAANTEKAVYTIFQAVGAILRSGNGVSSFIRNAFMAAVLGAPYVILVIIFVCHLVVSIFRAMMVGVFAPFLFMAVAFSQTRDMAKTGVKALLSSILVIFAVTAALSLAISSVTSSINLNPNMTGAALDQFASFTNTDFVVIIFLGWAGIALMAEAASMANAIAGAGLSSATALVIAGAMGMGAKMLGKAAISKTGRSLPGRAIAAKDKAVGGIAWASHHVAGGVERGAASLVDRFKNANNDLKGK